MQDEKPSSRERHSTRTHARTIYDAIRDKLGADLKGQVVAIEAESGEYFVGVTVLEAAKKARATHPDKAFHFFRISFPSVYLWR